VPKSPLDGIAPPRSVATWADLTERLLTLHDAVGRPTYDALSVRGGLARSAISSLIGRNPVRRPSQNNLVRFVRACLLIADRPQAEIDETVRAWVVIWQRLSREDAPPAPPAPPATEAEPAGEPSPPRRRSGLVAVTAIVLTVAVAGGVWFTVDRARSPEPPASMRCQAKKVSTPDARLGRTWDEVGVCRNVDSMVWERPTATSTVIGKLKTHRSWFVCWTRGQIRPGGSDIWYYTEGDLNVAKPQLDAWGFVPAFVVRDGSPEAPQVRQRCPASVLR
jgi:hypothetical protein